MTAESRPASPLTVGVCIATYKRPDQLRLLLEDLANQQVGDMWVVIAIADNDPAASADSTVAEIAETYRFPIRYVHEPRRGVVNARNASIDLVPEVDWIAFIDDDERPIDSWLKSLVTTALESDADAVAGPVPERFEQDPPRWYTSADLHIAESFPTGSIVKRFGVGNLAVRRDALDALATTDGPFDLRFNTTGGEDVFLGFQLSQAGYRMVWCDEAVATTLVPIERTELPWVLRRQFNAYRNYSRALRIAEHSQPWSELARSVARLLEASTRILMGALRQDKGAMVKGAYVGAGALGKFAGTLDRTSSSGWWD